jgi:hypothetical protein
MRIRGRAVVEHQQQAGKRQDEEKEKSDAAHAPRVAHADTGLADLDGMQVKENAAEHDQHAFAVGVRNSDTEYGAIDLTFLDVLADIRRRQSLESLLEPISEFCHTL